MWAGVESQSVPSDARSTSVEFVDWQMFALYQRLIGPILPDSSQPENDMADLRIRTTDGPEAQIAGDDLDGFAATLRGEVLTASSPQYDDARSVWNAMIDRHPAVIVRCRSAADVVRAVRFARRNNILVTVRGGGHNIGGLALADGAMVIDLSPMKSVHVDPAARVARVEPGVTLGEFDRDVQTFGLATPVGINSTTGISGLTLGGGYGWLSRRFGLTVDNLRAADVVTADGAL